VRLDLRQPTSSPGMPVEAAGKPQDARPGAPRAAAKGLSDPGCAG
jgi:hypothetical protein